MLTFNNSDIAILATVCVVNLFCAGVVRRAVLFNSGFIQRRILFEALSLFGFLAAIGLSLLSILVWVDNPSFVIACTSIWVILCLLALVQIWRSYRNGLSSEVLEIPEFWNQGPILSNQSTIVSDIITGDSTAAMSSSPKLAKNSSTPHLHDVLATTKTDSAAHASQAELLGKDVREKKDKYFKKRACKSAVISNLSVYRQRTKTVVPEYMSGKQHA